MSTGALRPEDLRKIAEEAAARGAAGGSPAEAVGEAISVAASAPDPRRLAAVAGGTPPRRRAG